MTTTTDKDAPITLSTGRTVTFKREENGSRTASIGGTATENGEQMTEAEWQELCAIFKEENARSAAKVDEWIGRAGEAERLAEERLAHANQLQADIEAEMQGRLALRKRLGAREDETMGAFLERLATMAGVVPANVHEHGWQWRPTDADTAFAPPFGTIRQCRVCGCLVAGGPTACARCAEAGA